MCDGRHTFKNIQNINVMVTHGVRDKSYFALFPE
jgi:hypothetical protein